MPLKTLGLGCPRNKQKKISVRTESNRNKICFAFVSVCFVKQKTKIFRFVSVFRTYIETTETNRTVSKQTETNQKYFQQNTYSYSLGCTLVGRHVQVRHKALVDRHAQVQQKFLQTGTSRYSTKLLSADTSRCSAKLL